MSSGQDIIAQTTEQIQITGFQDEGRKEELNQPNLLTREPSALVAASTKEQRIHTIPDFLQRTYTIDNFQWSVNDVKGKVLKQYRFPDILLAQPAIARKTFNFFGLRAGVELIVLVNKQPFQQGNLMISYLPGAKYNPVKDAMCQSSTASSTINLTTLSGMPRVNLDLMDATRADLTVPYASPFVYFNLLSGEGTIGDFYLTVYSKLRDIATTGSVSVQVLARFIDVDLQFPCGNTPKSFSKTPHLDSVYNKYIDNPNLSGLQGLSQEAQRILKLHEKGEWRFQMNTDKIDTINTTFKALPNMSISNVPNNSHEISTHKNSKLAPINMGQAQLNEMDFQSMVSIPCYFSSFDITSTATPGGGSPFYRTVTLLDYDNTITATSETAVDYITYIGQNFSKWRSSFKFRFRFVKTMFHSLRVRIWFAPGIVAGSIVDQIDRNAVISKIVDLKDNNIVDFEVPFVWPHPFLNTKLGSSAVGVIGLDVITKMVFPSTVSDTIEVIVERSAGSDFSVNLPTNILYYPCDPVPLPPPEQKFKGVMGPSGSTLLKIATLNESSRISEDVCGHRDTNFRFEMNTEDIGGDDVSYTRPVPSVQADFQSLSCSLNSVSDLINRSSMLTDTYTPVEVEDYSFQPHKFGIAKRDANNNVVVVDLDNLSYYSILYAFARGSVNIKLVDPSSTQLTILLNPDGTNIKESHVMSPFASASVSGNFSNIVQTIKPSLEGFADFTVPFYSDSYMYYVNPTHDQDPSKVAPAMQAPYTSLIINYAAKVKRPTIFRAAGSDFQFSYLTGPPRCAKPGLFPP